MRKLFLWSIALLCIRGELLVAQEETGMKPVAPQVMWAALPYNLEGWVLLKSTGETQLGTWLESKVVREFEKKIPRDPNAPADAPEPPPMWTRILVTDAGKHAD